MKKFGNILLGIILIVIGLIIGGNVLGITNINIFFDGWWTLFIIIPCFIGLFKDEDKTGSLIGLLLGVFLLLGCLDIMSFDLIWKLIIPISLVIIGLSIIFKDILGRKVSNEIDLLNEKRNVENTCFAIFSGKKIKLNKESFNGVDIKTVFGGIDYDLRNSIITNDVVINASAIFGGIDILVPENVVVKVKSRSIFGGVENETNIKNDKNVHTIYINGTAIFGGIEIK